MIDTIFIDFDGTLVDIRPRHYGVYAECVLLYQAEPLTIDKYWELKRADTKWATLLEMSGLDAGVETEFLNEFISRIEDAKYLAIDSLFDDSIETLQYMKKQGVAVVLVSLRRDPVALSNQIKSLGVDRYCDMVLSGHSNTKEGVLQKKAEVIRASCKYQSAMIIGDTEADIAAGIQLKIPTVALTRGIRDEAHLRARRPDYVYRTLREARALF